MVLSWDLENLLALARRQWFALCFGIAIALLLGILYMHIAPLSYTVSIQVVPAPASLSGASKSGLGALTGGLLGGGDTGPTSFKIYTGGL